jgi:hydroxymethylglutaryl-CoA reductase (NADPH)
MSYSDRFIRKAFENGLGREGCEVTSIRCLNAHLVGHAFKYKGTSNKIVGVYPYRIGYNDKNGESRTIDVMVKAKPDQESILRVYQGLLDRCGIKLESSLSDLLRNSDYWTPNLKEAVLFKDFERDLTPYLPRSIGVYMEASSSYTLRLEETLPIGSVILAPDDDTTKQWAPAFFPITLAGLAEVHGRFLNNYQPLLDAGYFFVCDTKVMGQARELWQAFLEMLQASYGGVMAPEFVRRHQRILSTLPDWYAQVDKQPKTLLYGDVNPQNLAFAKTEGRFELSIFDWERAVISMPQRDLAEFLIYTLPDGFTNEEAIERIEAYQGALSKKAAVEMDKDVFYQGLVWMLYDLMINRLPLMMIVNKVAGKRRHSANAYANAHLLLSYLTRDI